MQQHTKDMLYQVTIGALIMFMGLGYLWTQTRPVVVLDEATKELVVATVTLDESKITTAELNDCLVEVDTCLGFVDRLTAGLHTCLEEMPSSCEEMMIEEGWQESCETPEEEEGSVIRGDKITM